MLPLEYMKKSEIPSIQVPIQKKIVIKVKFFYFYSKEESYRLEMSRN